MYRTPYRRARPTAPDPDPHIDRVVIPGRLLRKLLAIHAYYEGRGERVAGVIAQHMDGDEFQAGVTKAHQLFHVKLRVSEQDVHEYGREEDA